MNGREKEYVKFSTIMLAVITQYFGFIFHTDHQFLRIYRIHTIAPQIKQKAPIFTNNVIYMFIISAIKALK